MYADTTNTYTRWFRVRARGPAGPSNWAQEYHVYGTPLSVTDLSVYPLAKITTGNTSIEVSLAWKAYQKYESAKNLNHPIDYSTVQYCIQSPTVSVETANNIYTSTIVFNTNEASWQDAPGGNIRDSKDWDAYSFSLDTTIPSNKMMFVRVNCTHDRRTTYGSIVDVKDSNTFLDPPDLPLINDVDAEQYRITITRPKNNCGIPNSFNAIYFRRSSNSGEERVVGIVPWGQDSGTMLIQCPAWSETDILRQH